MSANDAFARLPEAASFTVTSTTVADGAAWSPEQFSGIFGVPGGKDLSPQLSWSGAPAGHEELCRHRLRPRRPHRIRVLALGSRRHSRHRHRTARRHRRRHRLGPARGLDSRTGAVIKPSGLPEGAFQLPNDTRAARFIGAAPPAGHGLHRYVVVVHALDVESIGISADATPAVLGFTMAGHILGRADLTATAETAA